VGPCLSCSVGCLVSELSRAKDRERIGKLSVSLVEGALVQIATSLRGERQTHASLWL
jgi:hypothetical protein